MEAINVYEPPKLVREEFVMWKQRMKDFLFVFDAALWRSITNGPYVPTNVYSGTGTAVPKHESSYTLEDVKKMDVDRKAHAILTRALSNEIYKGLIHCKSAKELWDSLCEQYEETPDIICKRTQLVIQQYEQFGYISGESMTQQFERFMSLVSELKFYGKYYENDCLVNKFMRSLPSCWRTYTEVIGNYKDLTKMTLTQLHGHLKTYELELNLDNKISQGGVQVEEAHAAGGPQYFTVEDLEQFDPEYLELMDIQYQQVMLKLRIKRYNERTGKSIDSSPLTMLRFGFDKSKARCKSCQKTGHFARECKSTVAASA
ncbi:uncharacterized protein LOC143542660 [Bidens hawaiensis]|uniref:uncharacterized protein LOC143542660 n=1 Tax=Bidens hawaiensis TaxID=980011 RepID=UPI004049BD37